MRHENFFQYFSKACLDRLLGIAAMSDVSVSARAQTELLNVSYDPTRELYRAFNAAFVQHWKEKSGKAITIRQSHSGSGSQARAVIDGLKADVVTLALEGDINAIAQQTKKIPANWRSGCRTIPRPTRRPTCSWCARAIRRTSRIGTIW